jgi:hypothetical protein
LRHPANSVKKRKNITILDQFFGFGARRGCTHRVNPATRLSFHTLSDPHRGAVSGAVVEMTKGEDKTKGEKHE